MRKTEEKRKEKTVIISVDQCLKSSLLSSSPFLPVESVCYIKHGIMKIRRNAANMKRTVTDIRCYITNMRRNIANMKRYMPNMKRYITEMKCNIADLKRDIVNIKWVFCPAWT